MQYTTEYSRPGAARARGFLSVRSATWWIAGTRCLLRPASRIIAGAGTAVGTITVGVAVSSAALSVALSGGALTVRRTACAGRALSARIALTAVAAVLPRACGVAGTAGTLGIARPLTFSGLLGIGRGLPRRGEPVCCCRCTPGDGERERGRGHRRLGRARGTLRDCRPTVLIPFRGGGSPRGPASGGRGRMRRPIRMDVPRCVHSLRGHVQPFCRPDGLPPGRPGGRCSGSSGRSSTRWSPTLSLHLVNGLCPVEGVSVSSGNSRFRPPAMPSAGLFLEP